ncbi:MAG: hypothetical protein K2W99_02390 [Chthoniobacterales bacterium]|nr:hypothetical protein [Chthoniobacterales bacterium]
MPPSSKSVEEFILEFRCRQRIASSSPSRWDLFKERFLFFLSEFQVPKMAYSLATALALASSSFLLLYEAPRRSVSSTATSYPVVAKSFSIDHSSSTLVPQNNIIPISFQDDADDEKFFEPDNILPRKKLDFKKALQSF